MSGIDTPSPVMDRHTIATKFLKNPANYHIQDLFYSVTDLTSKILYGNEAFFKVAEYDRSELEGLPHNRIRNPATPKAVFKLLWEYLNAGKAVGAYVVNRTKTGKYYWVYGVFSPVIDPSTQKPSAFISVRLKPQSARLKVVQDLYADILDIEHESGMDTAYAALNQAITDMGFADYDAFVLDSLNIETNEFIAQDFFTQMLDSAKIQKNGNETLFDTLRALRKGIRLLDDGNKGLVAVRQSLLEIRELLEGTKHFFSNVRDASLNLAISAGNLDDTASRVLGPIVAQLIEMSESGEAMMEQFEKMANNLIANHKTLTFDANKVMFYSSAYHMDLIDKIQASRADDTAEQSTNENSPAKNMVEKAIANVTLSDLLRLERFVKNYVVEIQSLADLVTRKLGYTLVLGRSLTTQGTVLAEQWNATGVTNNLNSLQQDIMTIETKLDETANNFSSVLNTMGTLAEAARANLSTYEAFSTDI